MKMPKLYLVHCGFYDEVTSGGGVFEGHTNLFIVAESPKNAREIVKNKAIYREKRMHVDGIQEITAVDGYRIELVSVPAHEGKTEITPHVFRELAPIKNGAE